MLIDGEPVHGSRAIMARLEQIVPGPVLYPSERVREAELWGDLGGEQPNAADLQIGATLRVLLNIGDSVLCSPGVWASGSPAGTSRTVPGMRQPERSPPAG
jgi:hypothetical protein